MTIFERFEAVPSTHLFRSSAPNYSGKDEPHEIDASALAELRARKCLGKHGLLVVSLNKHRFAPESIRSLQAHNVGYHHIPTEDFHAPTILQLTNATRRMLDARAKLRSAHVFCGYGHGRTGTMVASYLILTGIHRYERAWAESLHVETDDQHNVLSSLAFGSEY